MSSVAPKDAKHALTPIDGWLRNQQETLPQLDAECAEKLERLDREAEAIRAAHETVKRVAAAIGCVLPSQKKKSEPATAPALEAVA